MPKPDNAKSPQDYNKGAWSQKFTDLECPSGQWCQVRRPGLQGLIKAGILHSLDQLTAIVQTETIPKAEGMPTVDVKKVMEDPKKVEQALEMMDKIVLYVVKQPKLHEAPENDEDRDDELIYVDEVDPQDKAFIMNFAVGGSRDLESFRAESAAALGSAPDGEADGTAAE